MGNKRNRNKERNQERAVPQRASGEFAEALKRQKVKTYAFLAVECLAFVGAVLATTNAVLSDKVHTQFTEHRSESIALASEDFREACEADIAADRYESRPVTACAEERATAYVDEGAARMAEVNGPAKTRGALLFLAAGLMFLLTHGEFRKLGKMEREGRGPGV